MRTLAETILVDEQIVVIDPCFGISWIDTPGFVQKSQSFRYFVLSYGLCCLELELTIRPIHIEWNATITNADTLAADHPGTSTERYTSIAMTSVCYMIHINRPTSIGNQQQ